MDVKYVAAAAAYVAARDAGIAVLEAIADALNVDRRTAARYVKRARELGYLVEDSDETRPARLSPDGARGRAW